MSAPRDSAASALAAVTPRCTGVQRVELRSADLARARDFYVEVLGVPLLMETATMFVVLVGETPVAVHGPASATQLDDTFDAARVGLVHLVVGCDDESELERVAAALQARGLGEGDVRTDDLFGHRYVAFRDPDGIPWELHVT